MQGLISPGLIREIEKPLEMNTAVMIKTHFGTCVLVFNTKKHHSNSNLFHLKAEWGLYLGVNNQKWEARWPHGYCTRLRSEWSGFEPLPRTLCCVLRQDTSLSQCLSPPRCINRYR